MPFSSSLMNAYFPEDQVLNLFSEVHGRTQKLLGLAPFGIAGESVEKVNGVLGYLLIAGQKAKVGIHAGGNRIVVAGSQMDVAADGSAFPPDHQGNFRVDFEAHHSIR